MQNYNKNVLILHFYCCLKLAIEFCDLSCQIILTCLDLLVSQWYVLLLILAFDTETSSSCQRTFCFEASVEKARLENVEFLMVVQKL